MVRSGSDSLLDCIDYVAGKYVESTGSDESNDCIRCAAGRYADGPGNDQQSDCTDCVAGKYVVRSGSDSRLDCIDCVAGKFVSATGSDEVLDCIDCAVGTFVSEVGSDEAVDCIDCVAGKYVENPGSDEASDCIDCFAGKYAENPGSDQQSDCTDCAAGQFVENPGSDQQSDCIDCVAGNFVNTTGSDHASDCIPCPRHTYSPTSGLPRESDCIECPCQNVTNRAVVCSVPIPDSTGCFITEVLSGKMAMEWTPDTPNVVNRKGERIERDIAVQLRSFGAESMVMHCGPDSLSNCQRVDCEPGHQPLAGGSCQKCNRLFYNLSDPTSLEPRKGYSVTGSACQACPAGNEPNKDRSDGTSSGCVGCTTGNHSDGGPCEPCAPGTEPNADSSGCDSCQTKGDRRYSPDGNPCLQCDSGWQPWPTDNRTTCIRCNASDPAFPHDPVKAYSSAGAECQECSPGKQPNPDQSGCDGCTKGRYSDGGACEQCAPGTEPNTDSSECDSCRTKGANMYSNTTILAETNVCRPCEPGSQPDENRSSCIRCYSRGENQVSSDGAECQNCSAGEYPTGKEPNKERTLCNSCLDGEFSDGGLCVCAEGYYNSSLGTFSCFESAAMDWVPRSASSEAVITQFLQESSLKSSRKSPCVHCPGGCAICGGGCSVQTPDRCGQVEVNPGFAPYYGSAASTGVGLEDNDVLLAEYFLRQFMAERPPHVGVYKCPRNVSKSNVSSCCGEGAQRNAAPECKASNALGNNTLSSGLCARGFSGVQCTGCGPGYTKSSGNCTLCRGGHSPIFQLSDHPAAEIFGIVMTALGSTGFLLFVSCVVLWLFREKSQEEKSQEKKSQNKTVLIENILTLIFVVTSAGFFAVALYMWVVETNPAQQAAYGIFTLGLLVPTSITYGMDLYHEVYIMDKLKVSLGFIQTLVAAKSTFHLRFPVTFSWLVDLIKNCRPASGSGRRCG